MTSLATAEKLALATMESHGLIAEGWSFRFNRAVRSLGMTEYQSRTISLSKKWAEACTEEEVMDTILHEVAHAIVGYGAGHGPIWQRKARAIGAVPKACTTATSQLKDTPPWEGTCPSCGRSVKRWKQPSQLLGCGYHAKFSNATLLEWRKNGQDVPMSPSYQRKYRLLQASMARAAQ